MTRTRAAAVLVAAALAGGGCIIVVDDEATLVVHNHSHRLLDEAYVADVDAWTWGPDLLPGTLYPGEDLVIDGLDCGRYDVRVVDDAGYDCVLSNLHLCNETYDWVLDDPLLDVCDWGQ